MPEKKAHAHSPQNNCNEEVKFASLRMTGLCEKSPLAGRSVDGSVQGTKELEKRREEMPANSNAAKNAKTLFIVFD